MLCYCKKIQTIAYVIYASAMDFLCSRISSFLNRLQRIGSSIRLLLPARARGQKNSLPARQHEVQGGVSSTRGCDAAHEWRIELRGL